MKECLSIGKLSDRVGLSKPTIRYYEELGLLDPPQRNASGYRIYSDTDEERLNFILKAKKFGLSLEEIKQLITVRKNGTPPCQELKQMVQNHLFRVDQHLQELWEFREELKHKSEQVDRALNEQVEISEEVCQGKICGLIENNS
ncbi:MAG: MerR family transcriptional regulator [Halothece sp.]